MGAALLATALSQQAADARVAFAAVTVTARAILAGAAGHVAVSGISAPIVSLANDIARGMFLARLKWGIAFGLILSTLLVGAVSLAPGSALTGPAADQSLHSFKRTVDLETFLPPDRDSPRTDAYGDPLPEGAVARLGSARYRAHTFLAYATPFVFAPDGQSLAAISGDSVRVLETATGRERRRIVGNDERLSALAFSQDGRLLAVAGKNRIVLSDVATGREVRRIQLSIAEECEALWFSADGQTLIGRQGPRGRTTRAWDLASGTERWHSGNQNWALGLAADCGDLITSERGVIQRRDAATGRVNHSWPIMDAPSFWPCLSPDGTTLVAGSHVGKETCLASWQVLTGKQSWRIDLNGASCRPLALAHHAPIFVAREEKAISVWDARVGQRIREIPFPNGIRGVRASAFSPDDRVLAYLGNDENVIRLLDLETGLELNKSPSGVSPVRSAAFAPTGQAIATGHDDSTITTWDRSSSRAVRQFSSGFGPVTALAFAPNGNLLASATEGDGDLRLWDTSAAQQCGAALFWGSPVTTLAFAPDGEQLAIGSPFDERFPNCTVGMWNTTAGHEAQRCHGSAPSACQLSFSADGQTLISCHKGSINYWHAATGKKLREELFPNQQLVFAYQGQSWVALGPGGWETKLGCSLFGPEAAMATKVCPQFRSPWSHYLTHLALSSDGRVLATGEKGRTTINLWDLSSGRELRPLSGHDGPVTVLMFSPDGQTLASGSEDTTVLLWDVSAMMQKPPSPISPPPRRESQDSRSGGD
jgi:WD40 repeat protein